MQCNVRTTLQMFLSNVFILTVTKTHGIFYFLLQKVLARWLPFERLYNVDDACYTAVRRCHRIQPDEKAGHQRTSYLTPG